MLMVTFSTKETNWGFFSHLSSFKSWLRWRCLLVSILRMKKWGGETNSGGTVKLGDEADKIDVLLLNS